MKSFKSIAFAALAILVLAAGSLAPLTASAQSSASLSIAPKKNYVIDAGETIEDKITIRNLDSNSPLQLYLRVVDFTYTDDTGTPKLMLDPQAENTTWSLRPFMKIPESVTIKAGSSQSLDMKVSIPAKQGAGSYYSAIVYSTGAPDGGNVGLSASGVTLAFVTIPGIVKEDLTLKKFGAYNSDIQKGKKDYMFITANEPKVIAYTLENKGNVAESPVGSIMLKSMFGQEYNINNINPNKSLALIGQTRTFESCIKLKSEEVAFKGSTTDASTCTSAGLWPGMYTASVDLFYGQNGNPTQEITKTAVFWYLPLWFIVVFILFLLALAFVIWKIVRGFQNKFYGSKVRSGRKLSRRR